MVGRSRKETTGHLIVHSSSISGSTHRAGVQLLPQDPHHHQQQNQHQQQQQQQQAAAFVGLLYLRRISLGLLFVPLFCC